MLQKKASLSEGTKTGKIFQDFSGKSWADASRHHANLLVGYSSCWYRREQINSAVVDKRLCAGMKAQSTQRFPPREPDEDDFTVKDVIDLAPEPTSRSLRYAFETSGYAIQRFVKMPGRGFYCLQVRRKSATPCASDKEARQRVAEILETLGLRPGKDDLLVDQSGDRLMIGLAVELGDVKKNAGFMEL